jgi:hypothetical protein
MRIFMLKTPVVALLLASVATLFSILVIPIMNYLGNDVLFQAWRYFYYPADLASFLCPSDHVYDFTYDRFALSSFQESSLRLSDFPYLFLLCALIQWYFIFLAGIVIYGLFQTNNNKDEPAA